LLENTGNPSRLSSLNDVNKTVLPVERAKMIYLAESVERELRRLAGRLGQNVDDVAFEAIETFIRAESVTDLSAGEFAKTQAAMWAELQEFDPTWAPVCWVSGENSEAYSGFFQEHHARFAFGLLCRSGQCSGTHDLRREFRPVKAFVRRSMLLIMGSFLPPVVRLLLLIGLLYPESARGAPPPVEPVPLGTVRALNRDKLAAHPPVRVRAVVTRSRRHSLFIQDASAGMYVNIARARLLGVMPGDTPIPDVPVGSEVEIVGVADPGGFSPIILPETVEILGQAEIPPPQPADPLRFFSGADDSQFVECVGIVEEAVDQGLQWRLAARHLLQPFVITVKKSAVEIDPASLIDAVVRVRGPTASIANTRGEFLAPVVFVEEPDWLVVVEPPASSAFESPLVPITDLARFLPEGHFGHRVRIQGTVIHTDPGHAVFLQDAGFGTRVQTRSRERFAPGDRVEAAGFVVRGRPVAELARAVVRRIGTATPLPPVDISPTEALDVNLKALATSINAKPSDFQGCLVRFPARLLDVQAGPTGRSLVLNSDERTILARLPDDTATEPALPPPGSELLVTGIFGIDWDTDPLAAEGSTPLGMSLLIRSPGDIVVTREPSPWTPRRLAGLLTAAAVGLAVVAGWAWSLRREGTRLERMVADRTRELAEARRQEKQTEEKQRAVLEQKLKTSLAASAVAHEINQPLSRLLLKCRLEADRGAADGGFIEAVVGDAERVVTTIEKMKVLLRNVETRHEPVDLGQVVTSTLHQVKRLAAMHGVELRRTGPELGCVIEGDDVQLQFAVSNLLRNAIEAIASGGGARREIEIAVNDGGQEAQLVVGDSGPGWPGGTLDETLLASRKPSGTGIGLFVVRTAVENHRGRVTVGRSPLGGAEFRITLPRREQVGRRDEG
jgi:signal transduction histidine kinase